MWQSFITFIGRTFITMGDDGEHIFRSETTMGAEQ